MAAIRFLTISTQPLPAAMIVEQMIDARTDEELMAKYDITKLRFMTVNKTAYHLHKSDGIARMMGHFAVTDANGHNVEELTNPTVHDALYVEPSCFSRAQCEALLFGFEGADILI